MRRGRLPLTALRSFESAGRLLSFTQAAEELFVTQAAISRQIRELERSLGLALFERHHRSVSLTVNGARLLARLTQSFDEIDGALRQMIPSSAATSLVVSAEPGFAACWLVPRLDRFRALRPEIDVEILSDSRVIEFRTSRAELAIRHGASATGWPRVEAQRLARSLATPVLSPVPSRGPRGPYAAA
jgi:LysR family glycine cleavage system transcriptional activator